MIERAAAADDRRRFVATRNSGFTSARRHETQSLDRVRFRRDLVPYSERFQDGNAFRGHAAAASLFSGKVVAVDQTFPPVIAQSLPQQPRLHGSRPQNVEERLGDQHSRALTPFTSLRITAKSEWNVSAAFLQGVLKQNRIASTCTQSARGDGMA